jgi:hypothetical protein
MKDDPWGGGSSSKKQEEPVDAWGSAAASSKKQEERRSSPPRNVWGEFEVKAEPIKNEAWGGSKVEENKVEDPWGTNASQ